MGLIPAIACQTGPCPALPPPFIPTPVQVCASSAECTFAPYTMCGVDPTMPLLPIIGVTTSCELPADAGASDAHTGG